jgi:hypothetical protein
VLLAVSVSLNLVTVRYVRDYSLWDAFHHQDLPMDVAKAHPFSMVYIWDVTGRSALIQMYVNIRRWSVTQ